MLVHIQEASYKTRYSVNTIKKYIQDCKIYGEGDLVDLNQLIERRKLTYKSRAKTYTPEQEKLVIHLFTKSNDNRISTISEKTGVTISTVNTILNKYLNESR